MEAGQAKPLTTTVPLSSSSVSTTTTSRTSLFSVEALISKPDHKTSTRENNSPVRHSNFSVERLLNRHSTKDDDVESKPEAASTERRDSKDDETSTDFAWMHSTRYDPPPSKYKYLFVLHVTISLRFFTTVIALIVSSFEARIERLSWKQHGPFLCK